MIGFSDRVNATTIDDLRRSGATKWSAADGSIGAFVAEMDFGIDPGVTRAIHQAVEDGAFGYMPRAFSEELSDATAEFVGRRYRWDVPAADVRAIPDVIMGLEFALTDCARAGSKVIVPTPAYMPFLMVPPMHGREVIELPLALRDGQYEFDLDALQQAFDDGGHLLLLCNPYNPVGRVFRRDELIAISEVVQRNGGRVFSDEIWAPLVFSGARHLPYASVSDVTAGHTLTAMSASKAWNLPGLKCAQLVLTNDDDRVAWERGGALVGHGTSNLGAVANAAAYRSGDGWLNALVPYLEGNRNVLVDLVNEHIPGAWMPRPEGTYVGWIDFRETGTGDEPAAYFKDTAGIALTEGSACGVVGAGFTRLIFATPRPILEQIVAALAAATPARSLAS